MLVRLAFMEEDKGFFLMHTLRAVNSASPSHLLPKNFAFIVTVKCTVASRCQRFCEAPSI